MVWFISIHMENNVNLAWTLRIFHTSLPSPFWFLQVALEVFPDDPPHGHGAHWAPCFGGWDILYPFAAKSQSVVRWPPAHRQRQSVQGNAILLFKVYWIIPSICACAKHIKRPILTMKFSIHTEPLRSPFFPAATPKKKQSASHNSCPGLCPQSLCNKKQVTRDFPGGPVVKESTLQCRDVGPIPGQRTKTPHATDKDPT